MTKPLFSFEFFPPQTAEGGTRLADTRKQLAALKPDYFSVTFGAGGSLYAYLQPRDAGEGWWEIDIPPALKKLPKWKPSVSV